MIEATFLPAPPLGRTVLDALGSAPVGCLVVNSARVAPRLRRAGHTVVHWQTDASDAAAADPGSHCAPLDRPPEGLADLQALVLVGVLTGREDPQADLRRLVRLTRPGAQVFVAEPAAYNRRGRVLSRLLGRFLHHPLTTDSQELGAICLAAGLTGLRQVWPQGLRSLVLTEGRVHPLSPRLLA